MMATTLTVSVDVTSNIYEGSFHFGFALPPQPMLAQTFKTEDQGLRWVITLRKGVLFHNGQEMTSDDVIASLKSMGKRDVGWAHFISKPCVPILKVGDAFGLMIKAKKRSQPRVDFIAEIPFQFLAIKVNSTMRRLRFGHVRGSHMSSPLFRLRGVTPFVECPHCHKLLEVGTARCPECREEISEEYTRLSAAVLAVNTIACRSANNLKGFDPFAVIVAILSLFIWFTDLHEFGKPFFFFLFLPLSAVYVHRIWSWLRRFGKFPYGDARFLTAKQNMKGSLAKWAIVFALQGVMLVPGVDSVFFAAPEPEVGVSGRWETTEASALPALVMDKRRVGGFGCYPSRDAQATTSDQSADTARQALLESAASRSRIVCLRLKLQRDKKLTGTVSLPLENETYDIEHGKVAGNSISFVTTTFAHRGIEVTAWKGELGADSTLTLIRQLAFQPPDTLLFQRPR